MPCSRLAYDGEWSRSCDTEHHQRREAAYLSVCAPRCLWCAWGYSLCQRQLKRVLYRGRLPRVPSPTAPPDALLVEDVDNRVPPFGEVLIAAFYLSEVVGRERVEQVPDARPRKAVDLRHPKAGRCPRRVHDLLGGTPAHAFRVAVAPHVGRERRPVAGVYAVADRLADKVGAYGPAVQAVAAQYLPASLDVTALRERTVYVEVIPPACELEPIETPLPALSGELFQRQISPLSRKKRHRSGHVPTSSYSLPRGPSPIRPYSLAPPAARSAATSTGSPLSMELTQPSMAARLLTLSAAAVSGISALSIAARSACSVASLSTNTRSGCSTGRGCRPHRSKTTSPVPRSSLLPLQSSRPASPTISHSPFHEVSGSWVAQSPW